MQAKSSKIKAILARTSWRGIGVLLVFALVTVFASLLPTVRTEAATNNTLNFQARLQNASGGIVADGYYNVQFKLYDVSSSGTALWTETYNDVDGSGGTTGDDYRVRVKNGYMSVNLGSRSSFPSTINWDQDLWLTMNIGGNNVSASPTWDGEMNPRLKLTGVPYAFKAGQLAQANGSLTSTLSLAAPTVGNQNFVIPDQGAAGTYNILTQNYASANYIQNTTTPQTANLTITGNGKFGGYVDATGGFKVNGTAGAAIACGATEFLQNAQIAGGIVTSGSCATAAASSGVTTVGTFSATSIANGASISGTTITLGVADINNPGMVSTTAQTFAGAKTFTGSGSIINFNDGTASGSIFVNNGAGSGVPVQFGSTSNSAVGLYVNNGTPGLVLKTDNNVNIVSGGLQTGGIDRLSNAGALSNIASISAASGAAMNITANAASTWSTSAGALTLTSAAAATWSTAAGNLTLDAAGGSIVLGTNTSTIQKVGTALSLDLNNSSNSTLTVTNSGTGVASLSVEGGINAGTKYQIAGADVLTSSALSFTAASSASITSAASQALGITSNAAATWGTSAGALTLNGQGGLNLQTGGTTVLTLGTNGSANFKNSTDSATAFQVNNQNNGNLVNVDSGNSNIQLLANNDSKLSTWTTTTAMSVGAAGTGQQRVRGGAIAANGYLYHLGGVDGTGATIATVEYSKINADGTVGTWASTTALPTPMRQFQPVVANGYIYVIGGRDNTNATVSTSYYAKINTDGTLGSWNTTTALTSGAGARFGGATVAYNGYIWMIGGFDSSVAVQSTVYSAKINANGTLAASWTARTSLSGGLTNINGAAVANGYVYLVGGYDGSTTVSSITRAKLNTDGTNSSWTTQSSLLSSSTENIQTFVANGYLYALGGDNATFVNAFALNADGSVNSAVNLTGFPLSPVGEAAMAAYNGYFYILGGSSSSDGGGTGRSSVYYASTPRVKVGGNLDLVAYGGENLNEGNTGGALTAGNTLVVGTLQVQDSVSFASSLSLGGNLTVGGGINSATGYSYNGTAGSTISCSATEFLQNATIQGGIVTGGSCATAASSSGVTTVGTFSNTSIANGASITGTTITFGAADATNPGMVSTGTQTFGGQKTFSSTTAGDFGFQASNNSATGYGIYGFLNNNSSSNDVLRLDGSGGTVFSVMSNGNTTVAGNLNANGNTTIGNATSDRLTVTSQLLGGSPLVFQGATDNSFTTTLSVTDPTANRTITLPNASGTIAVSASGPLSLNSTTGDISLGTVGVANGGTGSTSYTTNGIIYSNGSALVSTGAGTTGQCLVATTSAAPSWGSCGTGNSTTMQDTYNNSTGPQIQLNSTKGAIIYKDASTTIGSLFQLQNSAGTATYFGITSSGFSVQNSSGQNALTFTNSDGHLRLYTPGSSNYLEMYYDNSAGEAVIAPNTGNVRIGNGSGDIILNTSAPADTLTYTHTGTLSAGSSENSFAVTQNLVAGSNALTGAVLRVDQQTTGTNVTSAVLYLNTVQSSATLLSANLSGVEKFKVTSAGSVVIANNQTISTVSGNLGLTAGGANSVIVKAGTDNAAAFTVQNTSNQSIFGVDTSGSAATFGVASAKTTTLKLYNASSAFYVGLQSGVTTGASYTLTLPTTAPTVGQCLKGGATTATSLEWGTCGGGGGGGATKTVTLAPEYAGAVLSAASGSGANSGTLTSDYDGTNNHTYYNWTSSNSALQDYDVVVRTAIPGTYASGLTNLQLWAYAASTSTANNDILVTLKKANGTACTTNASILPTSATTWQQRSISLGTCTSTDFSADDVITIDIRVKSKSSNAVRIGEITYQYTN